uniref:Uncharacterized protein n=1 Tax=Leersia perrieri TaxID=77586 RepID=A0A0D9VNS8_9ORYZ
MLLSVSTTRYEVGKQYYSDFFPCLGTRRFLWEVEVLCLPLAESTDLSVDDNLGTQGRIPTPPSMF